MDWGVIILAILALPVMAIVGFARTFTLARELRRLEDRVNQMARDLNAVSARPGATAPQAAPAPVETPAPAATPAPVPVPAPPIVTPPRAAAVEPVAAIAAPPAETRSLEESLTSRWFVWLGAVAVALAGTFLVKYAIDEGWLGPATRVTLGFLLGMALAAGGEWLRRRPLERAIAAVRPNYVPPSLTASGLFVAFASIYAAYSLYGFLSPLVALLALAAVALLAVGLSLLQGMFVALLGVLGGFATPLLVSTHAPSAWGLFGYLIVIEAAAIAVARYKGWWWLALATLAGATFWPLVWMLGWTWTFGDEIPLGIYLILTAGAFFLLRRGWESPEGDESLVAEIRGLGTAERVVWLAGATIAALMLFAVWTAGFTAASLVFYALLTVLYMAGGRREGVFDGLVLVAAVGALLILSTMTLPGSVVVSLRPHAPLVPNGLRTFVTWCVVFGALFAGAGFAALWGAKRPALWAGVSTFVPVLLMAIAYDRITDLHVDLGWASIALGLALLSLLAAERVERYREAQGLGDSLGFYAAGVVAFLSLAATMSLREAWLTVALSIQLPMLAWIHQRIAVRSIRWLAAVVAGVVLVRLVLNYNLFSYPVGVSPVFSWVMYGYGIPAIAFFVAANYFRRNATGVLVSLLEAGSLAFFVLLISFEIRLFIAGRLDAPHYTLLEQSLQSISWLAIGSVLAARNRSIASPVSFYGARVLLAVAAFQIVFLQLLSSNPAVSYEYVGRTMMLDVLLLAYAVPAGFAFFLAWTFARSGQMQAAGFAVVGGFILLFAYVTLEVRHAFQGPILMLGNRSSAELYAYSIVWLIYAVVLLVLGIYFKQAVLRYGSLAIMVIVALKVFLVDMGDLEGLYRVGSFLGLGLSLVGIGLVYQRFVFPRPPVPPA